jgi:hypothetical protein
MAPRCTLDRLLSMEGSKPLTLGLVAFISHLGSECLGSNLGK